MPYTDKRALRKKFKALRDSLDEKAKAYCAAAIYGRLISLPLYQKCAVILSYAAFNSEVDMGGIITRAVSDGKTVALPRCNNETRTMKFYYVTPDTPLQPSKYGIPEPYENIENEILNLSGALCLVPALAYDRKGVRLGYGGGYYDRFLGQYKGIQTAGICYDICLTDVLPAAAHDISVNYIITEKAALRCTNYGDFL